MNDYNRRHKRYSGDRRLQPETFKYGLLILLIAAAIAAVIEYAPTAVEFFKSLF